MLHRSQFLQKLSSHKPYWDHIRLSSLVNKKNCLVRQLVRATGRDEGDTVRHLRQRVAMLLVRDNMAMLASRTPAFPPASVNGEI